MEENISVLPGLEEEKTGVMQDVSDDDIDIQKRIRGKI